MDAIFHPIQIVGFLRNPAHVLAAITSKNEENSLKHFKLLARAKVDSIKIEEFLKAVIVRKA